MPYQRLLPPRLPRACPCRSSSPCTTHSRCSSLSSANGTSIGMPARFAARAMSRWQTEELSVWNTLTAPPFSVSEVSGTARR